MKIIPLFESEETLIKKAQKGNAVAQRKIFERWSGKMLSLCRHYITDLHYSEDVMIAGFTKVFDQIHRFRFEGSFEGWIRRIMAREAIDFIRSRKRIEFTDIENIPEHPEDIHDYSWDYEQVNLSIAQLPDGYRTVLLLYAVEDFSHKEIAQMLNISENTSKSQLFKARKMLQEIMTAQPLSKKK